MRNDQPECTVLNATDLPQAQILYAAGGTEQPENKSFFETFTPFGNNKGGNSNWRSFFPFGNNRNGNNRSFFPFNQ